MHCHLIGLNHAHQLEGYKQGEFDTFRRYLTSFCVNGKIDLIAEELNQETIALWKAKGSVAKTVAKSLSIEHLFCDPELQDRRRLGIFSSLEISLNLGYRRALTHKQSAIFDAELRKGWPIREKCWLDQLGRVLFQRCAFILGAEHVDTFSAFAGGE